MNIAASGLSHEPDAVSYCDALWLMSIHASSIILLDVREIYDIMGIPNYR